MRIRLFHWFLLACLPVSISWAQEAAQSPSEEKPPQGSSRLPDAPVPKNSHSEEKPPRIFWIIPTYKITESKTPTRLTSREKFKIVVQDTTDPYTVGFIAFTAGLAQASNDMSGYGQGAQGYAKRFGAGMADQASAGFFGGFLFPSLLHQDPRYYRQGSGPFKRRFAHALIRPVVTYKDSDGNAFNWSGLLGGLAASGLANAYYPPEGRGVGKTFSRVAMGLPFSVIDHLVDEFGPDLEKKFFGKKKPSDP